MTNIRRKKIRSASVGCSQWKKRRCCVSHIWMFHTWESAKHI